jgi:hypothetical protein
MHIKWYDTAGDKNDEPSTNAEHINGACLVMSGGICVKSQDAQMECASYFPTIIPSDVTRQPIY